MRWSQIVACTALVCVSASNAQVSQKKQVLEDESLTISEIRFDTMDRHFVPLKVETRETKVSDNATRTDELVQTRLGNGQYTVTKRTSTMTEKVAPNETRSVMQVVDVDRQGQTEVSREVAMTTKTSDAGEQQETVESLRDHKGALVPARQTLAVSKKQNDGSVQTTREVRERTVNGEMLLREKVEETSTPRSANEMVVQTTTWSHNHVNGRIVEASRETTVRRTDGGTTQSESVISKPHGTKWEVNAKVQTTESKDSRGSVQREIIKYERPLHAATGASSDPLKPRLKIIERSVASPDGTMSMVRDVFFRDVNNEWKPHAFSTEAGNSSEENYGR